MKTGMTLHQKSSFRREVNECLRSIKNGAVGLFYYLEAIISYLLLNIKRKKKIIRSFFAHVALCALLFVAMLLISWPFPGFKLYGLLIATVISLSVFAIYDMQAFGIGKRVLYGHVVIISALLTITLFAAIDLICSWSIFSLLNLDWHFNGWWLFESITLAFASFGFLCKIFQDIDNLEKTYSENRCSLG